MSNELKNNELTDLICQKITQLFIEDKLNNDNMVQIIEHIGSYLNLSKRSAWAKNWNNATKRFRKNIELFGVKFVIDNE